MRLFIGISLEKSKIDKLCRKLYEMGFRGNFTIPCNYHITLAFIGDYNDPNKILEIINRLNFSIQNIKSTKVDLIKDNVCLKCESNLLNDYVKSLRDALKKENIKFDNKPFVPHITLIRKAFIPKINIDIPFEIEFSNLHVSLFESTRIQSRLVYREINKEQ